MQIDLSGRTALVCGASEGLGYASANGLARAGANLAICSRSADKLAIATTNLLTHDTEVVAIQADLPSTSQIDELASRALEHFGVIDILVNNAGGPPPGTVDDLTEADWRGAVD